MTKSKGGRVRRIAAAAGFSNAVAIRDKTGRDYSHLSRVLNGKARIGRRRTLGVIELEVLAKAFKVSSAVLARANDADMKDAGRANGHAAVNTARDGAETAVLRVADEVRTHPIASVVLAIAVGWAVGRFVSR